VFYYSSTAFTSTGSTCNTNCHYLEAAPSDQSSEIVWATADAFCYNNGGTTNTNNCRENSIYSGDSTAQAASRTAATAIGMGMANTNQIYDRLTTAGSVATSSYAAGIAWAYANNSKTDWFLPSIDELNELCKYARNTGQAPGGGTQCAGGSSPTSDGFASSDYWSSSDSDGLRRAWGQGFYNGQPSRDYFKVNAYRVRPVRAF
jgi:hypothetical protein